MKLGDLNLLVTRYGGLAVVLQALAEHSRIVRLPLNE